MRLLMAAIALCYVVSIVLIPARQVMAMPLHIMLAPIPPRFTDAEITLSVDPVQVLAEKNEEFQVEIKIATAGPTSSAGFDLSWLKNDGSTALICTGIEAGNFYSSATVSGYSSPQEADNGTTEPIVVGGDEREAGTGTLAVIHFKSQYMGVPEGIYDLLLGNCQVDGAIVEEAGLEHGEVYIGAAGTLEISPSMLTVSEGQSFSVSIKLTTDEPTNSAGFQLSWGSDSSHLTCKGIDVLTSEEEGAFYIDGMVIPGEIGDHQTLSPYTISQFSGEEPAKAGTMAMVSLYAPVRGVYDLQIFDCTAAYNGNPRPLVLKGGEITVEEPKPPVSPSNLRATAVGYDQIALAWNDNSYNESYFEVQRADNIGMLGANTVHQTSQKDVTGFTDYTVAVDTTYYYRVYAVSDNASSPESMGPSGPSNVLEVHTWPLLPPSPTELVQKDVSDDYAEIEWLDNAPNETGYMIERGYDEYFKKSVRKYWVGANIKTYKDITVRHNETYYYRVSAYNNNGQSEPCDAVRVTILEGSPDAPSDLEVDEATGEEVKLVWKDNANDETGFIIQRCLKKNFDSHVTRFKVEDDNLRTYTDDQIDDGKVYYYRVSAYNRQGESSPSNIVEAVIPATPTELAATVTDYTQVNLSWQDNAEDEEGYRVERSLNLGYTGDVVSFFVGPDVTSFSDINAEANTTYYYRVYAVNKDSEYFTTESPPSDIVAATTGTPPDPATMIRASIDISEYVDENGISQQGISVTTLNGIKTLEIGDDVQCLTHDDQPLLQIDARVVESDTLALLKHRIVGLPSMLLETDPDSPLPPVSMTQQYRAQIIGPVVDLQPSGALFSTPITLVLEYEDGAYPQEMAERDLVLAYYDAHADTWVEVPSTTNAMGRTIKADISHFSTYGIVRKAERTVEWWNMGAIIAVETVMALGILLLWIVKRRNVVQLEEHND